MLDTAAALCLFGADLILILYALKTPCRKNSRAVPGGARNHFHEIPAPKGH